MSAKWTRDERFIVCAYEATLRAGDLNVILDRYDIGKQSGITEKGVNAIGKQLMQANFIKLVGKTEMKLTSHGENLAKQLLQE